MDGSSRIARQFGYDGGMKAPSDKRLSAIAILIAGGILLFVCDFGFLDSPSSGQAAWFLSFAAIGAGVGAIFPRPIRSALIGAVLGTAAAYFLLQWLLTHIGMD